MTSTTDYRVIVATERGNALARILAPGEPLPADAYVAFVGSERECDRFVDRML